nr:putative quinol monooxygenase [Sedimentibacter sp.]
MLKIVAKGFFLDGKIDDAIKLYGELVEKSRNEVGCVAYNLFQDKNDETILTIIEEWESEEALRLHQNTEHFKRIVSLLNKLRKNSELNIYNQIL